MNVILIGFMGSGKSSVGKQLAKSLHHTFLDMDKEIENQEGCLISQIFEKKGEVYFRQLESDYLKEMKNRSAYAIIATGGGVVLREDNQQMLSLLGKTVYLKVTPEVVFHRLLEDTTRPLLKDNMELHKLKKMLEQREPIYERCADITIEVKEKSIQEIVNEIRERISELEEKVYNETTSY